MASSHPCTQMPLSATPETIVCMILCQFRASFGNWKINVTLEAELENAWLSCIPQKRGLGSRKQRNQHLAAGSQITTEQEAQCQKPRNRGALVPGVAWGPGSPGFAEASRGGPLSSEKVAFDLQPHLRWCSAAAGPCEYRGHVPTPFQNCGGQKIIPAPVRSAWPRRGRRRTFSLCRNLLRCRCSRGLKR